MDLISVQKGAGKIAKYRALSIARAIGYYHLSWLMDFINGYVIGMRLAIMEKAVSTDSTILHYCTNSANI